MVENEIDMSMKRFFVAFAALIVTWSVSYADGFRVEWKRTAMDRSRTGVTVASADNVKEAMGEVRCGKYYAPNGKVFRKGVTKKVASVMIGAQPKMAEVKQVVAYSTSHMVSHAPESALSDWFIDLLISQCSELTGKRVDVGFANFGGIRVEMPAGDVLLDDILSMFPFKNRLCYLELKGRDVRVILQQMASEGWQVIGGVRCVADKSGNLVSAEIGGEPLDDEKVYGVTTVDFLLDGGDGFHIGRNALDVQILDKYVIDVVLPHVKSLTAEGKPIEYQVDGRVKIVK